jgi:predicted transcriptional regulator
LVEEQNRYTNKQIAELLGISISTVKRILKYRKTDFEKEFNDLEIEIERTIQIRTSMNQS